MTKEQYDKEIEKIAIQLREMVCFKEQDEEGCWNFVVSKAQHLIFDTDEDIDPLDEIFMDVINSAYRKQ